ncbi:MAG: RpoL/Rpb11 RNA polymerase subunit family protein [Promethearchaeati archaeon SRVP18_Atabeyarchaeia-1]
MKVTATNQGEYNLEVVIEGEGHTLLNLLRDTLLDDDKVLFASYVIDHPMKLAARLALKTDGKNAMKTLGEASSKMASLVGEFSEKFSKAVESQK